MTICSACTLDLRAICEIFLDTLQQKGFFCHMPKTAQAQYRLPKQVSDELRKLADRNRRSVPRELLIAVERHLASHRNLRAMRGIFAEPKSK